MVSRASSPCLRWLRISDFPELDLYCKLSDLMKNRRLSVLNLLYFVYYEC